MARRIVILFSDTGGGHRSAGEAIQEALLAAYGERVEVELVDGLTHYAPPPLNRSAAWYPRVIANGRLTWGMSYWLSNGRWRVRLVNDLIWPYVRKAARRLLREHPADLYVSVHAVLTAVLREMGRPRPPFVTVVTDLVTTHAWWYTMKADLCLVPTEPAGRLAVRYGYPPERVRVVGLPVSARFSASAGGGDGAAV